MDATKSFACSSHHPIVLHEDHPDLVILSRAGGQELWLAGRLQAVCRETCQKNTPGSCRRRRDLEGGRRGYEFHHDRAIGQTCEHFDSRAIAPTFLFVSHLRSMDLNVLLIDYKPNLLQRYYCHHHHHHHTIILLITMPVLIY